MFHAQTEWHPVGVQAHRSTSFDMQGPTPQLEAWQYMSAASSHATLPQQMLYGAPYHARNPQANLALDYFDLSAPVHNVEQSHNAGPPSLATQFAAVVSEQTVPHMPVQPHHIPGNSLNADYSDDEVEDDVDEFAGNNEQPNSHMSTADRAAQKRRMKRFRLTHTQTRFLINEFVRHPHPDAAHRERLSKEIPGLSPRQVQVWFQNRRAKMKRLSPEDRERVLNSRMLPDDLASSKTFRSGSASYSVERPTTRDWSEKPCTSIATLNDLKQLFVQSVDAISGTDHLQSNDPLLSGIESIISQSAYPSPPPTSERSFQLHRSSGQYGPRRHAVQSAVARSTTDEEEEHPDAEYIRQEMQRRARQASRHEPTLIFGRPVSLMAAGNEEGSDEEYHEKYNDDTTGH